MLFGRPTELTGRERDRVDERITQFEERLDEQLAAVLDRLPFESLREQVVTVAFQSNDVLPKRERRPTVKIQYLTAELAAAAGLNRSTADRLVQFTTVVQECYDIFDDLVDGDVTPGRRPEAVVTLQTLFPVIVDYLGEFGSDVRRFWVERATGLMEAPMMERRLDPSPARYRDVLDRQGDLFGFVTGLVPMLADENWAREAERLGSLFFRHEQLLLDGEQYATGDEDPWNAWQLFGHTGGVAAVETAREGFESLCAAVASDRSDRIRPLVAVDLDVWCDSHGLCE